MAEEQKNTKEGFIQNLKRIALEQGLAKAVKEAKKYEDPYILDELHDVLADELKQQLLESGEMQEL